MKLKLNIYNAMATLLALVIFSCKPMANDAELASVDNLTNKNSNGFTLNSCGPSVPSPNQIEIQNFVKDNTRVKFDPGSENTKQDVLAVLEKIKEVDQGAYLNFFIKGTNAKISISSGKSAMCESIQDKDGPIHEVGIAESFSCWVVSGKDDDGLYFGTGSIFTKDGAIKSVSTSESIRHSLLRAMMHYVYALATNNAAANKVILANLFLNIDSMIKGLVQDLESRKIQNEVYNRENIGKNSATDKQRLVVETYDSDYCSDKTRVKLQSCFPNLYRAYKSGQNADGSILPVIACDNQLSGN